MNLEKEDSHIATATIKIEHFHYPPDFPVLLNSHSLSYFWTQTAVDLTSVNRSSFEIFVSRAFRITRDYVKEGGGEGVWKH